MITNSIFLCHNPIIQLFAMTFKLKDIFLKKHFLLHHDQPRRFTQARWSKGNICDLKDLSRMYLALAKIKSMEMRNPWYIWIFIIPIILIFSIAGDRVGTIYLSLKSAVSAYLLFSYVISHVDFVLRQSRINCKINRKDPTAITITSNEGQESRNVSDDIASKCEQSAWPYYWIYFTNWSWTLFVTSFLFDTTLVALRFYEERKSINVDLVGHPTRHINDGNYTATWFLSRNYHES